jgi:hypothetical protein
VTSRLFSNDAGCRALCGASRQRISPSPERSEKLASEGSRLSPVTRCLPGCCTPVTYRRSAACSLIMMQQTRNNKNNDLQGGQYARTEEELYKKALALLEKCKIETQSSGQAMPELKSTAA